MDKISPQSNPSVEEYLAQLDEQTAKDAHVLIEMMRHISGQPPKIWNTTTLGFDRYHYKYDSGREGDGFTIGFYPRKGKITVYLMDGTTRYAKELPNLGKHSLTGYCLYIKQLGDIDLSVLEGIVQQSYDFMKSQSKDGPVDRILWQTEE